MKIPKNSATYFNTLVFYVEKVSMFLEPSFLPEMTLDFVLSKSITADRQLMLTVKSKSTLRIKKGGFRTMPNGSNREIKEMTYVITTSLLSSEAIT